jgi:hypothetical protein
VERISSCLCPTCCGRQSIAAWRIIAGVGDAERLSQYPTVRLIVRRTLRASADRQTLRTGHGSRAFHFRGTSASRRRRLIARGIRRNGGHKAEQISVTRENGRRSQTCVSIVDRMDEQSKASACRIWRKPNMLLRTKWTLALLLAVSALFSAGPIGALAQGEGGNTPHRGFCRRMFLGRRCRLQTCEGRLQSRFRIRGRRLGHREL